MTEIHFTASAANKDGTGTIVIALTNENTDTLLVCKPEAARQLIDVLQKALQ